MTLSLIHRNTRWLGVTITPTLLYPLTPYPLIFSHPLFHSPPPRYHLKVIHDSGSLISCSSGGSQRVGNARRPFTKGISIVFVFIAKNGCQRSQSIIHAHATTTTTTTTTFPNAVINRTITRVNHNQPKPYPNHPIPSPTLSPTLLTHHITHPPSHPPILSPIITISSSDLMGPIRLPSRMIRLEKVASVPIDYKGAYLSDISSQRALTYFLSPPHNSLIPLTP